MNKCYDWWNKENVNTHVVIYMEISVDPKAYIHMSNDVNQS